MKNYTKLEDLGFRTPFLYRIIDWIANLPKKIAKRIVK